jgi:glycosyltransferase involved in cell wall biosynthesis
MKNNPPVLVILTPGFPKNENDFSCLPFVQSLIKAINKDFSFIKIIVLSFQYPFTTKEYLWKDNLIIPFSGKNKGKLLRRLLWIKVWRKLKHINNENKVIGLFSLWFGECALLGNRFGKKYSIPHYCWIAGQDAKANNKFVARINPDPKELVAVSDFIADEFFKNYLIRPLHIIPCGIEEELFQQVSYERAIDVLGAGSLISLKRYDCFVDCIDELRKTLPNMYAVIAGKGPEDFLLRKSIIEKKLQNNLQLPGEIEHTNLLQMMQQAKVFLHPSSYEGFSMACLEALYAGCHVISFTKPMHYDIDHWHIVDTREEMIEKTREILSQPYLEYKSRMPYSIDETAKSVMEFFRYDATE